MINFHFDLRKISKFFQFELGKVLKHPIVFQCFIYDIEEFASQGDIGFRTPAPESADEEKIAAMTTSVKNLLFIENPCIRALAESPLRSPHFVIPVLPDLPTDGSFDSGRGGRRD